jgi:EAL domain-containing protein (putative c-di-GMP-specific phosphodiesterase class I)
MLLPEIDFVGVFAFEGLEARTLAYAGPQDLPVAPGRVLPRSRAAYLQARAELGPWAETWRVRGVDGPYGERIAAAGVRAVAYVPLRDERGVFGVMGLGTMEQGAGDTLPERLPALGAIGIMAASRMSAVVRGTATDEDARGDLEEVIRSGAFRSVFQPIVDLRTGASLGYEALTRFSADGPPDATFRRAAGLGLGQELEMAAIDVAVSTARTLPADAFLTLNISPGVALGSGTLAGVLARADRPVVLEITERADVDDHHALRELARSLPVPARIAVDDAGAGFANLRHVMDLAPDIVKIDRSLVHAIDRDPARQALLTGLRHFAARRGIQLIAGGIETSGELATLTALGVPLGQGFLLGRPVPVDEVARVTAVPMAARTTRDGALGSV